MENFKINLKKIIAEDIPEVQQELQFRSQKGMEKIEGELEKVQVEKELIGLYDSILQKELLGIGLIPRQFFSEQRIHLLNNKIANQIGMEGQGAYISNFDSINLNKDLLGQKTFFARVLLHEMIHAYGFISLEVDGEKQRIIPQRAGYDSFKEDDDKFVSRFTGFNEAVVETFVDECIHKYKDEIIEKFNLSQEDLKETFVPAYQFEKEGLGYLIENIAFFTHKSPSEVWNTIKKGHFSGNMMHLRDVEKVFGPGSLRFVSNIGTHTGFKDLPEEILENKIFAFLESESQIDRQRIAQEILSEDEKIKFDKMQD